MRKFSFLLLLLPLLFSACKNGGINFSIPYSASFTVPSTLGVSLPLSIPIPEQATNSEQEFASNDTKAKWVKDISLESLKGTIENPVGEDFSFLKSVHIYISAADLPEAELAWADEVPANAGNTLDFEVSGADFSDYIKKDKFSLRTECVIDEGIFFDVTVGIDMLFDVTANAPLFQ
ncbi:MAG: hypothetical protein H6581_03440 [Bacteroidia bacterium]|nr:hypothetical protein [Bacteroidia bacterium]